jgi:CDP-glycerol glycerophosphotransferase
MCADERFAGWRFVWSLREDRAQDFIELMEVVGATAEPPGDAGEFFYRDKTASSSLYNLPFSQRAMMVTRGSDEYFTACARAKYWVVNNRMPEWVRPRVEQVFVQCWHGTPLKRLGHDVRIETRAALNTAAELAWRFGIDAAKWSYMLSPSPFVTEALTSAFDLKALSVAPRVVEEGYPRNDLLVRMMGERGAASAGEYVAQLKRRLGIPPGRKVLLYAPTWRDSVYRAGEGYGSGEMPNFERMREAFGGEWCVLLRLHYYVEGAGAGMGAGMGAAATADAGHFLIDVSNVSDINELYLVADALLTDYSSVLFDYANTGRPTIYYWPDLEDYEQNIRGFYFDPATLPGDKCRTTEELIKAIAVLDSWQERYGSASRVLRERFCPKDDGYAALRVLAAIFFQDELLVSQ